jgi:transcriptional regulator
MYIPTAFREDDQERLAAFIRAYSFGIVVSNHADRLIASHLPFLLDGSRGPQGTLVGHMARGNPQWRSFADGSEVLVMFQGPHAYISPSWYETRLSVPTWNYVAVHAYGTPRLVESREELRGILKATVASYEADFERPWDLEQLPDDYVTGMMEAIVGFEISISRLEGKFKLNQNRSEVDRSGVVAGLQSRGTPIALDVAALMAQGLQSFK